MFVQVDIHVLSSHRWNSPVLHKWKGCEGSALSGSLLYHFKVPVDGPGASWILCTSSRILPSLQSRSNPLKMHQIEPAAPASSRKQRNYRTARELRRTITWSLLASYAWLNPEPHWKPSRSPCTSPCPKALPPAKLRKHDQLHMLVDRNKDALQCESHGLIGDTQTFTQTTCTPIRDCSLCGPDQCEVVSDEFTSASRVHLGFCVKLLQQQTLPVLWGPSKCCFLLGRISVLEAASGIPQVDRVLSIAHLSEPICCLHSLGPKWCESPRW